MGDILNVTAIFSDGNLTTPLPYPDGCFQFEAYLGGELCGKCLEWQAVFSGGPLDGLGVFTDPSDFPDGDGCSASMLRYTPPTGFPTTFGSLAATNIQFTAFLSGVQFGPAISFACDPAAYATTFISWKQAEEDLITHVITDPKITFQQIPDGTKHDYVMMLGLLWDTPESVTWAIVQTAGTPVPDPSYFTIGTVMGCSEWDIGLVNGYDYSGTAFVLTATYAGNPLGGGMTWSCEV